jgi:hypothetical protein
MFQLMLPLLMMVSGSLAGRFSEFSGLVADVMLGSPGQELRFTLDLAGTSSSFVFAGKVCPPLIQNACFSPGASPSFVSTEPESGRDVLSFGNVAEEEIQFRVVQSAPDGLRNREVAGVIDMSRDSPIITDKFLVMESQTDDESELVSVQLSPGPVVLTDEPVWIPSVEEKGWCLRATEVKFGSVSLGEIHVMLDFSSDMILIPETFKKEMLNELHLTVNSDGSEVSLKNPVATLAMFFEFEGNQVVIPIQQLVNSQHSFGSRTYPLMIAFADIDHIRVGKQFLSSVDFLVLDRTKGQSRIGVGLYTRRTVPAIRAPTRYLPRFSAPIVVDNASGGKLVVLQRTGNGSLVLLSGRSYQTDRGFYYEFQKVRDDGQNLEEPALDLNGRFTAYAGLRVTSRGNLMIHLFPSQPTEVSHFIFVTEDGSSLRLRFYEVAPVLPRLDQLDLPSPKDRLPTSPFNNDNDCSICLNSIEAGHRFQRMRTCRHRFHLECVRLWLEGGHLNCPVCRAEVVNK